MQIVKSEWHQVEKRYAIEFTRDMLDDIYPDEDADVLDLKYQLIVAGKIDFAEVANDAFGVIDWEWLDEDDWWTDRKGGYEVTYEVEV